MPPASTSKQVSTSSETATLSEDATKNADAAQAGNVNGAFPALSKEEDELVEKEIRDRFKKMCEGYFDNVAKKLVIEHNVSRAFRHDRSTNAERRNSASKSRTGGITKHIYVLGRYSKTGNRRTRR